MTAEDLKKLAELLTAYNIELKTDGTKITHVNGHVAELKGENYMPDRSTVFGCTG